jgi:low affinity Fe/Cu permease
LRWSGPRVSLLVGQALHAKIDVLLRAEKQADNALTRLEPEEMTKYREKIADEPPKKKTE